MAKSLTDLKTLKNGDILYHSSLKTFYFKPKGTIDYYELKHTKRLQKTYADKIAKAGG